MSSGSPAVRASIFVAIVIAFLPAFASAQPVVLFDGPFTHFVENPCLADEMVTADGRLTITAYSRFDQSGGVHLTLRFISKGRGIAVGSPFQPAKEYIFNSEFIQEMNAPSNGTAEETTVLNQVLVRKSEIEGTGATPLGTGEDFMLKQTIHVTTRNGVPTATVNNGHARCM